jgi:hypothetical protein
LVSTVAAPVLGILVAALGLIFRKRWLQPALGALLFLFVYAVSWGSQATLYGPIQTWTKSWDIQLSYSDTPLGWISLAVCVVALILSLVASLLSPKVTEQTVQQETVFVPQSTQPSSTTAQPSGQNNLANLPLFALIGAFIIPLAGIILGHLSLSYMTKGQFSDENKASSTAGLILGYVFVGLSMFIGLILVIVLVVAAVTSY